MHLLKGHHSALTQKQLLWYELPCPPGFPGPHLQSFTHPPPGLGDIWFLSLAGRYQTVWTETGGLYQREKKTVLSSEQWVRRPPSVGWGPTKSKSNELSPMNFHNELRLRISLIGTNPGSRCERKSHLSDVKVNHSLLPWPGYCK